MKIKSLYIQNYRILQDIMIPFDEKDILPSEGYSLTVLAGLNGSGKSTILRALAEIYATIKADQPCEFNYKFVYELSSGKEISVDYSNTRENQYKISVDGDIQNGFDEIYKPDELVVHTTGLEELWDEIATPEPAQTASQELLDDPLTSRVQEKPSEIKDKPISTLQKPGFFLFRNQVASLVTLCGLLRWKNEGTNESLIGEVLNQLGIQLIIGFSLEFQLHPSLSNYDEFNRLVPLCNEHIQQAAMHKLIFDLPKNNHLTNEFAKGKEGFYESFRDLEKLLDPTTNAPAVLHGVEIFFEVEKAVEESDAEKQSITKKSIIPFSWLSDGEQNFLSRMAMLTLIDVEDSIILMDEPEVHFNDYWKRKIVKMVDQVLKNSHNHLIMTTHSSILLSDAPIGNVIYIEKVDGQATAAIPDIPIYGTDPGRIMVNLFNTENTKGELQNERLNWAIENLDDEALQQLQKNLDIGYWYYRIEKKLKGK